MQQSLLKCEKHKFRAKNATSIATTMTGITYIWKKDHYKTGTKFKGSNRIRITKYNIFIEYLFLYRKVSKEGKIEKILRKNIFQIKPI